MLFSFQKCVVWWYTAIESFSQNLQFNFSFQKDTKTTGVLFLLSITVQLHVVFFISLYIKYNTRFSKDPNNLTGFLAQHIPWNYRSNQRIGCNKKHKNIVRCSLSCNTRRVSILRNWLQKHNWPGVSFSIPTSNKGYEPLHWWLVLN